MQTTSDLHDRLHQRLQELSPPLLQMVLDFVEFLLGQERQLQATLIQATLIQATLAEGEDETQYLLRSESNAEHLARSIAQYRQGELTVQDIGEESVTP
ncbi:hypothetical protein [Prochlorothrix hollandica]|uniref:hypothetical protein n=1 Tax=Prochlorothrix hollandica TaxID=1223 RepID=UPI003341F0A7